MEGLSQQEQLKMADIMVSLCTCYVDIIIFSVTAFCGSYVLYLPFSIPLCST